MTAERWAHITEFLARPSTNRPPSGLPSLMLKVATEMGVDAPLRKETVLLYLACQELANRRTGLVRVEFCGGGLR